MQLKHTSSKRKKGSRAWYTRDQLIEMYKSECIADEIIRRKVEDKELARSQIRDHPDAPGVPASRMY